MSELENLPTKWSKRYWHTLDYEAGRVLLRSEVVNLENFVIENPGSTVARLLLAGYYERSLHDKPVRESDVAKHLLHFIWLIDHDPANPDLGYVLSSVGKPWHKQINKHWIQSVKSNPETVQVLINAAQFLRFSSVRTAENLWNRIVELDPLNGRNQAKLAFFYVFTAQKLSPVLQRRYAEKAIVSFKRCLDAFAQAGGGEEVLFLKMHRVEIELLLKFAIEVEFSEDAGFIAALVRKILDSKAPPL